jgi:hypothetical protein
MKSTILIPIMCMSICYLMGILTWWIFTDADLRRLESQIREVEKECGYERASKKEGNKSENSLPLQ